MEDEDANRSRKRSYSHTEDSESQTAARLAQIDSRTSDNGVATPSPSQHWDGEARPRKKIVACTNCRQSKLYLTTYGLLVIDVDVGLHSPRKMDELEQQVQDLKASLHGPAYRTGSSILNTPAASPSYGAPGFVIENSIVGDSSLVPSNHEMPAIGAASEQPSYVPMSGATRPGAAVDALKAPYVLGPDPQRLQVTVNAANPPTFVPVHDTHPRPLATKVRAIESTALGQQQIDDLFEIYFQHYHTFLPVLDTARSPDEYYEKSPFLFWTLIGVAARMYQRDPYLVSTLSTCVQKLAWNRIAEPPLPLPEVQALCLLCTWPSIDMHAWSDASMLFSNIAMASAMHLGLHRPDYAHEFSKRSRKRWQMPLKEPERFERGKTWAVCNIISQ
ncbi:MAG: hypothetical protein M1818_001185 [Claussenomyces sp. TS43310]|nr:MAG: hypothetical protein M1818_001185 [Claussenomyces sp. TS43310]